MMNHLTGRNLIAGTESAAGTHTYRAVDPQARQPLEPDFHEATESEVDRACEASYEAFVADRSRSSSERADLLEAIADEIESLGDQLVARVAAETALGDARIRSERGRTTGQLRLFASLVREGSWVDARIDTPLPARTPAPRPDLRRMLVALGPVGVFGAVNFPLAFSVAGGDTASALAAGCPVIVKAHPAHPGTSELVGRAVGRAVAATGFHPGTFSLLHGPNPDVSLALVRHPRLAAVGFTGSLRAGRALFDAAAARPRPIPVFAEMGSVNPVFVLPGALEARMREIATGLVDSVTLGAGQFCTNPGLVVGVASSLLDAFVEEVSSKLRGCGAFTMLHEGIRADYMRGTRELGETQGVRAPDGVAVTRAESDGAQAAVFVTDAATFTRNHRLQEEVFGPSTLVVRSESPSDMLEAARTLDGNLTATIHGTEEDLRAQAELVHALRERVGRLIFNGFPTGVEVSHAMQHGGPYPATTDARGTSVGTAAIYRFVRPICYQNFPDSVLPPELRNLNERRIWRLVDGTLTKDDVS